MYDICEHDKERGTNWTSCIICWSKKYFANFETKYGYFIENPSTITKYITDTKPRCRYDYKRKYWKFIG